MEEPRLSVRFRSHWLPLAIFVGIPIACCAAQLTRDIWYDEAYSIDVYAFRGFREIFTDYSTPNNHILYTLFLRVLLLHSDHIAWLRFPNLIFATIALVATYRAGRRLISRDAGLAAISALGMSIVFLVHAMQLRGYGASMAIASLLMALAVRRRAFAMAWPRRVFIVVLICAFVGVLPTNVLFATSIAGASLLHGWLFRRSYRWMFLESATWCAGLLLGCACYLPVADQLMKNRSLLAIGNSAPTAFLRILEMFTRDMRWLILPALPLGLYAIIVERSLRGASKRIRSSIVVLVLCLGPFFLQALIGLKTPFDRTFTPVLPAFALLIGWVMSAAVEWILRKTRPEWRRLVGPIASALLTAVLLASWLTYPERLDAYRDQTFAQDGYYCYYAADYHPSSAVAFFKKQLRPDENYAVVWDRHGNLVFSPYLRNAGVQPQRIAPDVPPEQITLYYFAPVLAKYEDLMAATKLPEAVLRRFDDLGDFGYFHLFKKRVGDLRGVIPAELLDSAQVDSP